MNTTALRTLVIYAVILPLAVFIGWMAVDLANWNRTSFAVFAAVVFVLLVPALLRWHYEVLLLSWNTFITVFFLPGSPALWMLMAGITFGIAILNRIMHKRTAFIPATSVALSLLALAGTVVLTGWLRGGFGSQALGSSTIGGKGYYYIIAAIIGYFALISRPVDPDRGVGHARMFFLPGIVAAVSNLIYFAGQPFYFLFLIFPATFAGVQALSEMSGPIVRVAGFAIAGSAVIFSLLAVHGIRGVLQKWYLLLIFFIAFAAATLAGYRSAILLLLLVLGVLFVIEGLLHSPIFPALLLGAALGFAALVPVASKLPLSVQRTLSFLPLKIDLAVRNDAEASVGWRLRMWELLLPELPKYFWLGKGYALNPLDVYLADEAVRRGRLTGYEQSIVTGEYHNGPLSTYIPFGLFGTLAFIAFLGSSLRALYFNYRFGDDRLKTVNRFLLAYFIARTIFFVFAFGALSSDLFHFTGAIGLSIALNRGICRRPVAAAAEPIRFRGNLQLGTTQPGAA